MDKGEGSQKFYKPWGGGRFRWITKLLDVNINNVFVIGIFGMVYAKKKLCGASETRQCRPFGNRPSQC